MAAESELLCLYLYLTFIVLTSEISFFTFMSERNSFKWICVILFALQTYAITNHYVKFPNDVHALNDSISHDAFRPPTSNIDETYLNVRGNFNDNSEDTKLRVDTIAEPDKESGTTTESIDEATMEQTFKYTKRQKNSKDTVCRDKVIEAVFSGAMAIFVLVATFFSLIVILLQSRKLRQESQEEILRNNAWYLSRILALERDLRDHRRIGE